MEQTYPQRVRHRNTEHDPPPHFLRQYSDTSSMPTKVDLGQTIRHVLTRVKSLVDSDLSKENVSDMFIQFCLESVIAETGEFLIAKNGQLQVLSKGRTQLKQTTFPIDEQSLVGWTAVNKRVNIITNGSSSTLYNSFRHNLYPMRNGEAYRPNTILSVPLLTEKEEIFGVVVLFNKQSDLLYSFFTQEDAQAVSQVGDLVQVTFKKHEEINSLKDQLASLKTTNKKTEGIMSVCVESVRRKNLLRKLGEILTERPMLTWDLAKMMSKIMLSDAVIIHLKVGTELVPQIAYGITARDLQSLHTEVVKYAAEQKGLLKITDLENEPLWEDYSWDLGFKSLIAQPVIIDDEVICILQFLKSGNEVFNNYDEEISKSVASALQKSPQWIENFVSYIPGFTKEDNLKPFQTNDYMAIESRVLQTQSFSQDRSEKLLDYIGFFTAAEGLIRQVLYVQDCTVWILDEPSDLLWTRKSEICDVMTVANDKISTVGLVANEKQVLMGNAEDLYLPDSETFSNLDVLAIPVFNKILTCDIYAVILCTREMQQFSQVDIEALQMVLPWFQLSLDQLSEAEKPAKVQSKYISPSRRLSYHPSLYRKQEEEDDHDSELFDQAPLELRSRASSHRNQSAPPVKVVKTITRVNEEDEMNIGDDDLDILSIPAIEALFDIQNIAAGPWFGDVLKLFNQIKEDQNSLFDQIAQHMKNVTDAESVRLYVLDDARKHLIDLQYDTPRKPEGCIQACIASGDVMILEEPGEDPNFNANSDNLDLEELDNLMIVPIFTSYKEVRGIIAAANGNFDSEAVQIAKFLALIIFFVFDHKNHEKINAGQGRRLKMLMQWCKQVFVVSVNQQYKKEVAKNIIYSLSTNSTIRQSLELCKDVIQAGSTSNGCVIYLKDPQTDEIVLYENGKYKKVNENLSEIEQIISNGVPQTMSKGLNHQNAIVVPIRANSKSVGAIKVWDKREDTLKYWCQYNKFDECMILDFCRVIGNIYVADEADSQVSVAELQGLIRYYTNAMNSVPLVNTIRSAAQKLLDCDRGTVFTRKGNNLTVQVQGEENEIPQEFTVPLGVGIVGHVAQTGITENIVDVYDDPRFNQDIDRRTGYRTGSMLCMPVLDAKKQVIAALQMINKKDGKFDEEDIGILEMFCEMASSALQNVDLFTKGLCERTRLLSILNSMKSYILVFDVNGFLTYWNKAIVQLFGIDEKRAEEKPYHEWIKHAKLANDLKGVLANPQNPVSRKYEKLRIVKSRGGRKTTLTSSPTVAFSKTKKEKELQINYNIMPNVDFETQELIGLVLILEDVSTVSKMRKKVAKMKKELRSLKSVEFNNTKTVTTDKPLEQVIQNLRLLAQDSNDSSSRALIEQTIHILKAGNLERAKISIGSGLAHKFKEFINQEYTPNDTWMSDFPSPDDPIGLNWKSFSQVAQIDNIELEVLRDWNLNVWEIEDHIPYVLTMFNDFDLMKRFDIKVRTMVNFVNQIRDLYETHNNPYHNFLHGFNVQHVVYFILSSTPAANIFSPLDILALLIAALCHDVSHTGRTNAFEISSESSLAIVYHDKSVLEQHHAAQTFKTMQQEGCDILSSLKKEDKKQARKLIIETILSTDMSHHFVMINDMNTRFDEVAETPLGSKEDDKRNAGSVLMHCADLSNATKPYDMLIVWSKRVNEEFAAQVESERTLGLPVTEFMLKLDEPKVFYKNELNFNKFVVAPMWECINKWLSPHIEFAMGNLDENVEMFQKELNRHSSDITK